MECRAEINRFAIFLFCLLVPLGSMAPTETSESKVTTGQGQKHFTTEIPTLASVILQRAQQLFKFYQKCISESFQTKPSRAESKARNMSDRIPECPAFHANCCALHHIYSTLKTLEGKIETICNESSKAVVEASLNQLHTTLTDGAAFYTCRTQDPPQGQTMSLPVRKKYIWWVLKKYEDIMQLTEKQYSRAAV